MCWCRHWCEGWLTLFTFNASLLPAYRCGAAPHVLMSIPRIRTPYITAFPAYLDYLQPKNNIFMPRYILLYTPISFTCKMVKFSNTLFIMYFSGRCFNLCMKLIIYSHIGLLWMRYTNLPFSYLAYSVSTFSTTCLPNEHTFVEHVMVIFSLLSYLKKEQNKML